MPANTSAFYRWILKTLSQGSFTIVALVSAAAFSPAAFAQPGIIPIGSNLIFGGTNAPDTYSATTTFGPTPVLVDNGAVKIWQQQVATGAGGEWDVFYLQTTAGGPLAGNISANWNIVMSYEISQPAYFDQVVSQWLVNGTPVGPLTNGVGSLCCASATNPILPGYSYYASGFSSLLAVGVQANWQEIFVSPYNYISDGGVNPSTANEFIFALHFTLQTQPLTTTLATAYQIEPFASEAIVTAFGSNLATGTENATTIPLPTALQGTTIMVTDSAGVARSAPLYYVSPGQINYQIPPGSALGAATVTVTPGSGSPQTDSIQISNLSPGLFELNSSGLVAAWVLPIDSAGKQQALQPVYQLSGSSVVPLPVDLSSAAQIYLELYGTGLRHAENVTVDIGGVEVPVAYAGPAPGEVGEDQVNVGPLPASLAGKGNVNITLTADTQVANTVTITIQ